MNNVVRYKTTDSHGNQIVDHEFTALAMMDVITSTSGTDIHYRNDGSGIVEVRIFGTTLTAWEPTTQPTPSQNRPNRPNQEMNK